MKSGMTARKLRMILSGLMLLIVVAATAGFLFAQKSLNEYAVEISRLNADAASGDQNLQTLNGLQAKLDERKTAIDSAHALVADEATYADKAINDITRIANEAGVRITSFEFVENAASTPGAAAAAPAPATAPTTTAPTTPTAGAPAGVAKKTISVAIESPLEYSSLMKFISGIETNQLKMQIPSVAMTKGEGSKVSTQQFTIEVYVRS